jgi:hypothetical protein
MNFSVLLSIIFFHTFEASFQFPYPNQSFKLPEHPLGWICTVHVTVATLADFTSSDTTERFLTSNHEKIIPTLSTMLNRSLRIAPVHSFFEPCTISVLIDANINGRSYMNGQLGIPRYINTNEYVHGGWRHSIIIFIYFSCDLTCAYESSYLPHRVFYYSTECGLQNTFPNIAFVPDRMKVFWRIDDKMHNIHNRQLPLGIRRLSSKPAYSWDGHNPGWEVCLASRWDGLSKKNF